MIEYTSRAERDLEEILDFLLGESQTYAVKILGEIGKKLTLLEKNSQLGRPRDDFFVGLRSFPVKKFVIFYTPTKNGIEVFRVLHGSRDIESEFEDFFEGLSE